MHEFPIVEHFIGTISNNKKYECIEHFTFSKAATGRLAGNIAGSIGTGIKKVGGNIGTGIKKVGGNIGTGIKKVGSGLSDTGSKLKSSAKKLGKVGDEVGDITKKIDLPPAYSKLDDIGDIAKDAKKVGQVTDAIGDVANNKSTMKQFLSNYGTVIVAGTTVAAIAASAAIISEKINNTNYTITSIKKDSTDASKTVITYTPEDKFTKRDSVTISNSDSNPSIDGEYSIEPMRAGAIKINKQITKQGGSGFLKCYTDVSNQTTQIINEVTKPVTTTAGGIAGGVISDVFGDVIPSTLKSMGIGNVSLFSWISLGISVCLMLILFSIFIISVM